MTQGVLALLPKLVFGYRIPVDTVYRNKYEPLSDHNRTGRFQDICRQYGTGIPVHRLYLYGTSLFAVGTGTGTCTGKRIPTGTLQLQ
jgi:hypothetical protein